MKREKQNQARPFDIQGAKEEQAQAQLPGLFQTLLWGSYKGRCRYSLERGPRSFWAGKAGETAMVSHYIAGCDKACFEEEPQKVQDHVKAYWKSYNEAIDDGKELGINESEDESEEGTEDDEESEELEEKHRIAKAEQYLG